MNKVVITIDDFVDSVDVLIDEKKMIVGELSTSGRATYECAVDCGVHSISIIKRSKVLEKGWGKHIFFHWVSMFFGFADWTIADVKKEAYTGSFVATVNVQKDEQIHLSLSSSGVKLIDSSVSMENVKNTFQEQPTAKKRAKIAFLWPTYILIVAIAFAILTASICMVIGDNLAGAAATFCAFAFFLWIFLFMFLKTNRTRDTNTNTGDGSVVPLSSEDDRK